MVAGRGTELALALMALEVIVALLLFYVAWARTDIQDHMLGAVLGIVLLVATLIMQIFFFKYPDDRRPIVFFLTIIALFMMPGIALMLVQAATGIRVDLNGPNSPSPLILLPYIIVVALIFFRMVAWAMTFEPAPGSRPVGSEHLRQQILAMRDMPELPFDIKPGKRADELIVDWKYADATWLDLMRIHRISSLARLVLRLDETSHTVRVREYQSQFDASAGLGGLALAFKGQWGAVSFYDFKRETVFGVQIENGRPVAKLSYSYHFDINEMRDPLRRLANQNGWTYKSVPLFVKWLTG